jgi:hypothetical protein
VEYPWKHHGSLHSRVLEVDPVLGKTTTYWYDDNTREQFVTDDWHDVRPIIEHNKALYNATDERARMTPLRDGGEMQWTRVATLPLAIAMDVLKKTDNGKNRAAVSRWLMDPDNRHFLTRPIRTGV